MVVWTDAYRNVLGRHSDVCRAFPRGERPGHRHAACERWVFGLEREALPHKLVRDQLHKLAMYHVGQGGGLPGAALARVLEHERHPKRTARPGFENLDDALSAFRR